MARKVSQSQTGPKKKSIKVMTYLHSMFAVTPAALELTSNLAYTRKASCTSESSQEFNLLSVGERRIQELHQFWRYRDKTV